jgi:hypothetical protein
MVWGLPDPIPQLIPPRPACRTIKDMACKSPRRVDWHELERRIPLDELPAFHRAFLESVEPSEDWGKTFLRRIQGKVQANLQRLRREGRAEESGEQLWVDLDLIPETCLCYLEE